MKITYVGGLVFWN